MPEKSHKNWTIFALSTAVRMKKLIPTSEFSKNVITLITGTGLGQFITIASSVILTRLFTPDEYASFALFYAAVNIVSIVAAGRFELAILIPKKEDEAKSLVALCLILSVITSLLTLTGVIIYDFWLHEYWPNKNFNVWFYLIVPAVFILGAYKAMNYWSTRHKTYKLNALGRILISAVVASLGIVFGFFGFIPGLIIAFVVGNLVGLIALSADIISDRRVFFAGVNRASIKSIFSKHSAFAKINVPHALVDNFQANGVVFIIASFFTDALVGLYDHTFRMLRAPLSLIGSAYYQVFYQKITQQHYSASEIKKMVLSVYKRTFLIGIIPFSLIFLFAPAIFGFVWGENWREAGVIAQIIAPWLFLNFIVSPVSCIPLIFNKQGAAFLITCVDIVCRFSLFILAGIYNDSFWAFASLSIVGSITMIFAMFWYLRIVVERENESVPEIID